MAVPSSLTLNYDAVLSTTLFNYQRTLQDTISTSNPVLFALMKGGDDLYAEIDDIGDRMQIPLMYALAAADSYSGYDLLDVDPFDGITSAFYDWRQMATKITISGLEEKKNNSEAKIIDLLQAKTRQAVLGIQDLFGRALLQGLGAVTGASITSAYVSPTNGSTFIDPLPKLIGFDPTAGTIGNISPTTASNPWWQNKYYDADGAAGSGSPTAAVTTWNTFLVALRHLRHECAKGPGGSPDLHCASQGVVELYEAALSNVHRNPSYQVADIPFENVGFYGKPVTWDEFMPDAKNATVTQTKGTWYMLNTKFFGMKVHKGTNFAPTPFEKPINQDAKTAHILWLGALGVSNRRKHGVMGAITMTISS